MAEASLYERLGGVFPIAAVVDHFSDAVVHNPITGQGSKDPKLDEWSTDELGRLPGLKFQRTLWVCEIGEAPSDTQARNRAVLSSAWRRPIGRSRSLPQSSTNSWLSLGDRSTTSRCPRKRKGRYSLPSPPTKAR